MFGIKTNDTLVTSIVGALGLGIIYLVTTSYKMNIDVQNLKDSQEKNRQKINLLVAYIEVNQKELTKKLTKKDLLIFLSDHGSNDTTLAQELPDLPTDKTKPSEVDEIRLGTENSTGEKKVSDYPKEE